MKINYHTANAALGATALYNGNISSLEWTTGASCLVNGVTRNRAGYGYAYDGNNRLTRAKYGEYTGGSWNTALNNYNTDTVTYDRNGNIKTMTNRGWTGSAFGLIDQLTYSYDANVPNRLMTMSEASSTTKGFKSLGGSGYTYDANGNVTVDSYKGITRTVYNYLNLPDTVFFGSKYLNFTYDAGGTKWRKKTVDGGTVTEKHYLAGIEYTGTTLEAIYHSEGRARSLGGGNYEYQYTIKDHLGNSRVMYKVVTGTATILQENHYYPFGMGLENTAFIDSTNKYRFGEQEWVDDFGYLRYSFFARHYEPSIGRWLQLDPLAEIDQNISLAPANFVANNPILNFDPNGMNWYRNNETNEIYWQKGKDEVEGSTNLGTWYVFKGPKNTIVYFENQMVAVGDAAQSDDWAYARQHEYMTEQPLGIYNPRATEALLEVGGLIQEALLLFGPVKTGYSTRAFRPVFPQSNSTIGNVAKGGSNIVDDIVIQFGKGQNQVNHAFRHTDALGLNRSLVQSTIRNHLKSVSSQVVAGRPFNQIIEIGEQRIQYTAYKLSNGTFNIGRIHAIK